MMQHLTTALTPGATIQGRGLPRSRLSRGLCRGYSHDMTGEAP